MQLLKRPSILTLKQIQKGFYQFIQRIKPKEELLHLITKPEQVATDIVQRKLLIVQQM